MEYVKTENKTNAKKSVEIVRGDVVKVDLGSNVGSEQSGIRPCVVLSNDLNNIHCPSVNILPLTSKVHSKRKLPVHVIIDNEYIKMASITLCEQIKTVDKSRIVSRVLFKLNKDEIEEINRAVKIQLGLLD